MPRYKVLAGIVGILLDIYQEMEVVRGISSFGTYLSMVTQVTEEDIAIWTVVFATTDLGLIPHQIAFMIAGLETPIDVIPRTWSHCQIYIYAGGNCLTQAAVIPAETNATITRILYRQP